MGHCESAMGHCESAEVSACPVLLQADLESLVPQLHSAQRDCSGHCGGGGHCESGWLVLMEREFPGCQHHLTTLAQSEFMSKHFIFNVVGNQDFNALGLDFSRSSPLGGDSNCNHGFHLKLITHSNHWQSRCGHSTVPRWKSNVLNCLTS